MVTHQLSSEFKFPKCETKAGFGVRVTGLDAYEWSKFVSKIKNALNYGLHCNDLSHRELETEITDAIDELGKKINFKNDIAYEVDWDDLDEKKLEAEIEAENAKQEEIAAIGTDHPLYYDYFGADEEAKEREWEKQHMPIPEEV